MTIKIKQAQKLISECQNTVQGILEASKQILSEQNFDYNEQELLKYITLIWEKHKKYTSIIKTQSMIPAYLKPYLDSPDYHLHLRWKEQAPTIIPFEPTTKCKCGATMTIKEYEYWAECVNCRSKLPIQTRQTGDLGVDSKYHGNQSTGEW